MIAAAMEAFNDSAEEFKLLEIYLGIVIGISTSCINSCEIPWASLPISIIP
jgi:hypothetical protein